MHTSHRLLVALVLCLSAPVASAEHGHSHILHKSAPEFGSPDGTMTDGVRVYDLTLTKDGFQPTKLRAYAGEKIRLTVTRTPQSKCPGELAVDGLGITRALPIDIPVSIEFTVERTGTIRIHCGAETSLNLFVRRPSAAGTR